ncbi:hypothetical protein [Nonomuraea typhae]|uniref:hypothetical protein n=1 Tax=Nonomuraea typhae TaxID=2603600 RepID=UPI0012FAB731|nr:hypothetical protein [Nonomuraea typhae]
MTPTRTPSQTRRHPTPAPPQPPPAPPTPTRAADLRHGHAVRIAGYGTLPVAAPAAPIPPPLIAVRLGWAGLSLIVHPTTPLDAITGHQRAEVFRIWCCRHCAGTGQWQPERTASNGVA